jgi:AcrR family transcriptional regulator
MQLKDEAVERQLDQARNRAGDEITRILQAARTELARNGWHDFKVNNVLHEAGLSTRAFYRDFSGKSSLLLMLFEEDVSKFARHLVRSIGEAVDPLEQLMIWITLNINVGYDERTMHRARLFAHAGETLMADFPAEVTRIRRLIIDPLEEIIIEGRRRGIFPHGRSEDAVAIWLMTSSLTRGTFEGDLNDAYRDKLIDLVQDFSQRAIQSHSCWPLQD